MDLKAIAQAELAKIIMAHSGSVVTVVSGDNSASCILDVGVGDANLDDEGERGLITSRVFCNADTIGAITNGQSITVKGTESNVMTHETDPMGAMVTISYTQQKPR